MDRTNRNTALASALVEELARSGVEEAVICPGSRSTPIGLALLREPRLATISIVDERSAAFFALGAANATRRPVVIACTSGTAAANIHPAVCEADEASVPLIVLTSDRPPELRGIGAGQTIDQVKLYGSAVRWFCEVGTHDADDAGLLHYRSTACRAYAAAVGDPRPGPAHLNLAWRDPLGPEPAAGDVTATSPLALGGRDDALPLTDVYRPIVALADDELDEVSADLRETERGLIVAGRQADPGLGPGLAALSHVTGYPVLAEPTSQARITAQGVIESYDAIARAQPRQLEPELVVRFGDMPTSKALREWLRSLEDCAQLVVDQYGDWKEHTRHAGLILRADPSFLARAIANGMPGGKPATGWRAQWVAADAAATAAIEAQLRESAGLTEPGVHTALGGIYEPGDLVYTASSMPIRDQESFLTPMDEVLFLANRGANGIDGLVSAAAGAAHGTARPTWLVLGDLALHHDSNGLAALRDVRTPVRIVCLNNNGGGIFEFLPQAGQVERQEFEAIFGTPLGLDLAPLAVHHGIEYRLVQGLGDLAEPSEGHVLFDVRVDRRENVAVHNALWTRAVAAVNAAVDSG